jgi:hypothetical protein
MVTFDPLTAQTEVVRLEYDTDSPADEEAETAKGVAL